MSGQKEQKSKDQEAGEGMASHKENDYFSSLMVLYLVCGIEGLDLQLLPASFKALEYEMGIGPGILGVLAMGQAIFQAVGGPIWGSLADRGVSRKLLIGWGAVAWGLLTFLLAFSYDPWTMFALRCLNGLALSALNPIAQSLVADIVAPSERGLIFGIIDAFINFGRAAAALTVTAVSHVEFDLLGAKVLGWRIAFMIVGILSLVLVAAIVLVMTEPPRAIKELEIAEALNPSEFWETMKSEMGIFGSYFKIPSFVVILVQGMFGCIPWAAMAFMTMWFQYMGMSDTQAGSIVTLQILACALGAILGGFIGDRLSLWSPYHGRPLTAQISVLSGVILYLLILTLIPPVPSSYTLYVLMVILFGLTASWAGVACNQPLLIDLVDAGSRGRIIALLISINGATAALLGGPVVGLLAEAMGYETPAIGTHVADMEAEDRIHNREALGDALMLGTIPPWFICFIAFGALHFTYRRDMEYRSVPEKAQD